MEKVLDNGEKVDFVSTVSGALVIQSFWKTDKPGLEQNVKVFQQELEIYEPK